MGNFSIQNHVSTLLSGIYREFQKAYRKIMSVDFNIHCTMTLFAGFQNEAKYVETMQ